jgi:hypothetical protein
MAGLAAIAWNSIPGLKPMIGSSINAERTVPIAEYIARNDHGIVK